MPQSHGPDELHWCNRWLLDALDGGRAGWTPTTPLPFSFRCGGRPAHDWLSQCQAAFGEENLPETGSRRTARFVDPRSALQVEYVCTVFDRYRAAEVALVFTNRGSADAPPVSSLRPLDVTFADQTGAPCALHAFRGGIPDAQAYALSRQVIAEGSTVTLGARGGRSSGEFMPWLNTQVGGGGLLMVVGWSGQWEADVGHEGGLRLRAGVPHLHGALGPGETLRSPRVLLLAWDGEDVVDGFNDWRRLFLDHYAPRANGTLIQPPVAKLTPYDEIDLETWTSHHGEANQLEAIAEAAALGVEAYWLDAYWFEGYYPRGLGNWQFPVEKTVRASFPRGLRPLADAAHRVGMQFILWFAPEVFSPGTYVDRHAGDWTLRLDGVEGGLFNLGLPEAQAWITRYITESLEAFGADVCRMDLTRDPLDFWRAADPPGRTGWTELRYVEGLYQLWDDIRRARPGVWIDNCSSGGQRLDLETCTRSLPLWRSDFNDTPKRQHDEIGAITDQAMVMGLNHCLPFHGGPVWRPTPYYWRSALAAGMNIYWDLRPDRLTGTYAYDRVLTQQAIDEYKGLRRFFTGDYYPLTPINTHADAWAAYELCGEDGGFAVFFRRPEAADRRLAVRLRGVDASRRYRVESRRDYGVADSRVVSGAELADCQVEIPEAPGSMLVRFTAV